MLLLAAAVLAPPSWTLVLGGDLMFNGIAVNSKPFAKVAPLVRAADLSIANLEIPLTDQTTITSRKTASDRKAKKQFVLRGDPRHAATLGDIGLDGVSLGNNHAMDYGARGLSQMQRLLSKQNIVFTGAGKDASTASGPVVVKGANDTAISLLSFLSFRGDGANYTCSPATINGAGVSALVFGGELNDVKKAKLTAYVKAAEAKNGFVVVAMHWGIERDTVPTAYQVALARAWIDAGADLVVGHHPHVLQGAEMYNGKPILYSVGNMISSLPANTALFKLRFEEETFASASVLPCRISGGAIAPYTGKSALSELKRFRELCAKLRKRYPNKKSADFKVSLEPAPIVPIEKKP